MKFYTMQTIIRPEVARFDVKQRAIVDLAMEMAIKILQENVFETTEKVDGVEITKLSINVVVATPEEIEAKIRKHAEVYGANYFGSQFSAVIDTSEEK